MNYSQDCTGLVQSSEGCAKLQSDGTYHAYPDPGSKGVPYTIGWGSTGGDIGPNTVWNKAKCDIRLAASLTAAAMQVSHAVGNTPTTQGQFDALVDFQYNTGALSSSTLLRLHNGHDYAGAADQFSRWVHASGRVLPGLVTRRLKETALYNKA